MSSPFLNKLLFYPETPTIQDLEPYMYLEGRECFAKPVVSSETLPKNPVPKQDEPKQPTKNTLFWSVFLSVHEYGEYMEALRRSGNREVEEKIRMVDSLKKSPKILKDTNSKLTIEQTQALYGSLLTSREDRIEFCAAYAAFYKRTIWLIYPKTYRVYSPTTEVSLDADAIVIKVSPGPKHTFVYSLDQEPDIKALVGERVGILNAQSKYKTAELVDIANKLGLPLEPKAKKQEVYDAIRVAIHKDMNFGGTS